MSEHADPGAYRELTIPAMILGVLQGALMTAGFVYIALKLGFSLGGSTVAAILGFVILRGLLKGGTIVENNINQTVASGVNTASSGVAFTLPALFILGKTNPDLMHFSPWPFVAAATCGAFLGTVLIIPLRKQMIEFERLRFPTGIAVATLLKSPGAGAYQAKVLGIGFAVSAFFTVMVDFNYIPEDIDIGAGLGVPTWFPLVVAISFANFGAGLLAGRGGLPFVAGGVLAWWIISPIATLGGWIPDTGLGPMQAQWQSDILYGAMLRPLGIGILIGGALTGVIVSLPALKSAIHSLSSAVQARTSGATGGPQEMSSSVMIVGILASLALLFAAALLSDASMSVASAALTSIVGTLWLAVAGLVVAQATGMTDISPMSGMSLIGVTLIYFLTSGNVIVSIVIGVAICIGIGQCADMMQDLKSGHLIGATPRLQQLAQFSVAWIGAPVAIGTVYLIWNSQGFGPGAELSAPQGQALAAIIDSLRAGESAVDKYLAGAVLGGALGFYPVSGLGVLVGLAMYLPFSITLGYGIGGIAAMILEHRLGHKWASTTMIPLAAGFIVGEALTKLAIILPQAF